MDFVQLLRDNDILRRYIVMNAFDGTLTTFGILLAMKIAGVTNTGLIVISVLGAVFATGISGVWGAYLVEKAERKHELSELKKLHPNEDLSARRRKFRKLTVIMGLANGLSSTLIGLIIASPFFLVLFGTLSLQNAFWAAGGLIFISLLLIGATTAHIAKEHFLKHAAVTLFAALMVGIILFLFELIKPS